MLLGRSIFASGWTIGGVRRAVDAEASHRQDGREHARRLLPSAAARLRHRPAGHRRRAAATVTALALVAVAVVRRDSPDDGAVVRRVGRRGAPRERAALRRALLVRSRAIAMAGAATVARRWASSRATRMDAAWLADAGRQGLRLPQPMERRTPGPSTCSIPSSLALTYAVPAAPRSTTSGESGSRRRLSLARRRLSRRACRSLRPSVAAFVQLQVSRVFWMADALSAALCRLVAVRSRWERGPDRGGVQRLRAAGSSRPILVTALLVAAASLAADTSCRRASRPAARRGRRSRTTSGGTCPTWLHGTTPSGRARRSPIPATRGDTGPACGCTAARDVLLENVKDGSIGDVRSAGGDAGGRAAGGARRLRRL